MGGCGSGYPSYRRGRAKKVKAEYCLHLPVGGLVRHGFIPAAAGAASGTVTYGTGASVGFVVRTGTGEPTFRLTYTAGTTPPIQVDEVFRLTTTRPQFGGVRWWFACRGAGCGRRVGTLYLPLGGLHFRCRTCHDLTYALCQDRHHYEWWFGWLADASGYPPAFIRQAWNSIGKR